MDKLQIALTPEAYKLWVIRPEILFIADQVIVDKKDYNEIKCKEDRSSLDKRISILLEGLADDGLVEFKGYQNLLPLSKRNEIHNLAKTIISELTPHQILRLYKHAWKEYSSYLRAKLLYLRPGEPLFIGIVKDLHETEKLLGRDNVLEDEELNHHIRFVLTRIVAKWIAGEIISTKIGVAALHDTDEYRPFAKIIREKFVSNEKEVTALFFREYDVPLQLLLETIRLCFNISELRSLDDLRRFKLNRAEFRIIRDVFRDILSYYQELKDTSLIRENIRLRIEESREFIEQQLKKLPSRIFTMFPAVVDFLLSLFGISTSVESMAGESLKAFARKRTAKTITKKYPDPFVRLCCFAVYAERDIPILAEINVRKDGEEVERSWIRDSRLPWYESGESETK